MKQVRPIRWKIAQAASEFLINPRTLSARIKTGGIEPGSDGCFSTRQIVAAVHGDMQGERLREVRARAEALELENAKTKSEFIALGDAMSFWGHARDTIRSRLLSIASKCQSQFHPGCTGEDLRRMIEAEVDSALLELSRTPPYEDKK